MRKTTGVGLVLLAVGLWPFPALAQTAGPIRHIRRVEKVDGKLVNVLVDRIPAVDQFWTPPR